MSCYETIVTIGRSVDAELDRNEQNSVVKVAEEKQCCCLVKNKKLFGCLGVAFSVIVVSCACSLVTIRYFSSYMAPKECERCNVEKTASPKIDVTGSVHNNNKETAVPERQIQPKTQTSTRTRTGALVRADKALLHGHPSKLKWSNTASNSYLDGIFLVPYIYMESELTCLKISTDDNYLITVQITYLIKNGMTSLTYFSLVRFRNDERLAVATRFTDFHSRSRKISESVVIQQRLQEDDILCVIAEDPELIYASSIDNFFGASSL